MENSWGHTGGFSNRNTTSVSWSDSKSGFFNIVRGKNECGIETLAYAGWAKLPLPQQ